MLKKEPLSKIVHLKAKNCDVCMHGLNSAKTLMFWHLKMTKKTSLTKRIYFTAKKCDVWLHGFGVGYIGVEYIGKVLKMAKKSHTRCKLPPHIFFTPCFVCFGFYTLHTRNMTPKHRNTSCKHMILRVYTVFFCVLGSR